MAVRIRLRRMGRKNRPFYRVVVTDARNAVKGKYLEMVGWYDPLAEGTNFSLKLDRIQYWQAKGAQMSESVRSLVRRARRTPSDNAQSTE
ncbi:MAG TPA: 30S ribosomal protein S16 [Kiritimatiellae bacterium]|nr:30S ribosomal protein S16 [Kiritimatiellia bacterium]